MTDHLVSRIEALAGKATNPCPADGCTVQAAEDYFAYIQSVDDQVFFLALRNAWPGILSRLRAGEELEQEAQRLAWCNDAVEADAYSYDPAEIPMSCVVALRAALEAFESAKKEGA